MITNNFKDISYFIIDKLIDFIIILDNEKITILNSLTG